MFRGVMVCTLILRGGTPCYCVVLSDEQYVHITYSNSMERGSVLCEDSFNTKPI